MKKIGVKTGSVGAVASLGILLPLMAFADDLSSFSGITGFIVGIETILEVLLPLVVTLAVLVFFWGLVKYLWSAGDEAERQKGKGLMVWGVIALFVMVSVWGLITVLGDLVGVQQGGLAPVPSVGDIGNLQ